MHNREPFPVWGKVCTLVMLRRDAVGLVGPEPCDLLSTTETLTEQVPKFGLSFLKRTTAVTSLALYTLCCVKCSSHLLETGSRVLPVFPVFWRERGFNLIQSWQ